MQSLRILRWPPPHSEQLALLHSLPPVLARSLPALAPCHAWYWLGYIAKTLPSKATNYSERYKSPPHRGKKNWITWRIIISVGMINCLWNLERTRKCRLLVIDHSHLWQADTMWSYDAQINLPIVFISSHNLRMLKRRRIPPSRWYLTVKMGL